MKPLTYPKNQKLKSFKLISALFASGKSVKNYPLKLIYIPLTEIQTEAQGWQVGVSVAKRNFKKAVDRNRIKRLLRETYRLNQHQIKDNCSKPYALMIIYQSSEKPVFEELDNQMKQLFQKFLSKINTSV